MPYPIERRRDTYRLPEDELPKFFYNVAADWAEYGKPLPPYLHPGTGKALTPGEMVEGLVMGAGFLRPLAEQEVSLERYIPIPEPLRDLWRMWRPTYLHRAYRLEKRLDTPARIYYKNESQTPVGSHKANAATCQACYAMMEGYKTLTSETGAGQWGSSLAFGCKFFDIHSRVYMVRVSYYQKPMRRIAAELWGGELIPSPSLQTEAGRRQMKGLEHLPEGSEELIAKMPGSLAISIAEAVEDAVTHAKDTRYAMGSVGNHVLMSQTVIGQETMKQFEMADDYPDIMIGCIGGGSSFGGFHWPFIGEKILRGKKIHFIAVEPKACPSVSRGMYRYDFPTSEPTPLFLMHTLGHRFIPPPIHAGGLRYHGMAPAQCHEVAQGITEIRAAHQLETFEAARIFAECEGVIPAPEPAHAIKVAFDEALKCKETGESKCIAFLFCGHGIYDLPAYDKFLAGKLEDYEYPEEKLEEARIYLDEMMPVVAEPAK